jgi:hypothetical protein
MRLSILIAFLMTVNSLSSVAQFDAESAKSHVIVKYSPWPMFDFDNTIQFGVEIPLGKGDFTIQQDLGYGNSSFCIWYQDYNEPPGKDIYKSRTQFRWYYFEKRRVRGYVGPEFLFKKVVYRDNQWVGMDCADGFGNCGYFENKAVRIDKNVSAGHARFGWQFYFPRRITLDLFTGIGFRGISSRSKTPQAENARFYSIDDYWQSVSPGTREFYPSIVLGFHFGVVLGKSRE